MTDLNINESASTNTENCIAMMIKSFFTVVVFLFSIPSFAQHYQVDFSPEEFKARWQIVFDKIGDQAIAIVQGALVKKLTGVDHVVSTERMTGENGMVQQFPPSP